MPLPERHRLHAAKHSKRIAKACNIYKARELPLGQVPDLPAVLPAALRRHLSPLLPLLPPGLDRQIKK